MKKRVLLKNNFFDLLAFLISFILSFFRSFFVLFQKNKRSIGNKFFDILDFIFRRWPKYFWEKPSLYKFTSYFGDLLSFIFNSKNK